MKTAILLPVLLTAMIANAQPRMFAEGIVSTTDDEFNVAFTPDGHTVYFTKSVSPSYFYAICVSHLVDGTWSTPEVAAFSGVYRDFDPFLTPDGRRLFFVSDRPKAGGIRGNIDIWVVDKTPNGWSTPRNLGPPVNTDGPETFPNVTADGTLYFASQQPGGKGGVDLYRSRFVDGRYTTPENLGDAINSPQDDTELHVTPDESMVIFNSNRPGGQGHFDLYISRRQDGRWTNAVNLGTPINSEGYELNPLISPDGKRFFFASDRGFATATAGRRLDHEELDAGLHSFHNGLMNIYSVDVSALTPGAPMLLGEGVISTPAYESGTAFTPDGRTLYFAKRPAGYNANLSAICVSHLTNGTWSTPEVASFSGQYRDSDPFVTIDGAKLFFTSDRPADGQPRGNFDIWFVEKSGDRWGEPQHLASPINTPAAETHPSVAADGTLYFASDRAGGKGRFDIYRARPHANPEALGDAINSQANELQPYVAPDQSFLIFAAIGRPDELVPAGLPSRRGDLYISRFENGAWTPARSLGPKVNTFAAEGRPSMSPDGKILYFTSERGFATSPRDTPMTFRELREGIAGTLNGLGNVYWVEMKAIE